MKRILLIIVALVLIVGAVGAFFARSQYIRFVESDHFRAFVQRNVSQGASTYINNASVTIDPLRVVGMWSVTISKALIQSGDRPDQSVVIENVRIDPSLWALLSRQVLHATGSFQVPPTGTVTFVASVPISSIAPKTADVRPLVAQVSGQFADIDPVPVVGLLQTSQANSHFRLKEGQGSGSFSFDKFSTSRAGSIRMQLSNTKWTFATDDERIISIADLPIELSIRDFELSLAKPIILPDDSGTATITGSVQLPRLRGGEKKWNMHAKVVGNTSLVKVVALLFRCQEPPIANEFAITGPFSKVSCQ